MYVKFRPRVHLVVCCAKSFDIYLKNRDLCQMLSTRDVLSKGSIKFLQNSQRNTCVGASF